MRVKRTVLLLTGFFLILACSFVQGPITKSAPTKSIDSSPTIPATSTSEENTTEIIYEFVDESPAPDKFTVVQVGNSKEKLLDILQVEAEKASNMDRQPYVEFYADWCPPCNAIRDSLEDERMVDAFTGTYIIKLDFDYWQGKLSGTGLYVPGIPAFYEIDVDGIPTGRMITGAAWGEDVPENIAPPLKEFFNQNKTE